MVTDAQQAPDADEPTPLGPLRRVTIDNFMVFERFDESFSPGLNVIIGTNGTGKSVFLRTAYAMLYAIWKEWRNQPEGWTRSSLLFLIYYANCLCIEKSEPDFFDLRKEVSRNILFSAVFNIAETVIEFNPEELLNLSKEIDTTTHVLPTIPLLIPSHELISSASTVVGLARKYKDAGFSKVDVDLATAVLVPELREENIALPLRDLREKLARTIGGTPRKGSGERFVLSQGAGSSDLLMVLVAEGHRKLAQLVQLIQNGSLTPGMTLFWDEPETNLNPALQRLMAVTLVDLVGAGVQVFVATHSFFLMKEISLEILRRKLDSDTAEEVPCRYFSFSLEDGKVAVERGDSLEDLQTITALDAAIDQEDRAQELYSRL
mgnify:CR=1 FL=1